MFRGDKSFYKVKKKCWSSQVFRSVLRGLYAKGCTGVIHNIVKLMLNVGSGSKDWIFLDFS